MVKIWDKGSSIDKKIEQFTVGDDFIIDHHPANEDVIITAGFSGHGFKFTSVVGEIVTDLVEKDNSDYPIEFLKLKRFSKNSI